MVCGNLHYNSQDPHHKSEIFVITLHFSFRTNHSLSTMDDDTIYGHAPINICICSKCVKGEMSFGIPVVPQPSEIVTDYPWAIMVECGRCNGSWYICCTCDNVKTQFDTIRKLRMHQYRSHRKHNNNHSESLPAPMSQQQLDRKRKATQTPMHRPSDIIPNRNEAILLTRHNN